MTAKTEAQELQDMLNDGATIKRFRVTAREMYVEQRWEMYELPSGASAGIGIRNKATLRKVAHVPPGPHDLDAARLIEAAPELLEACERAMMALGRGGANVTGGPNRAEWELLHELSNKVRWG